MDEQTKQALLIAVLAFNVVIILFQVLFNGFPGLPEFSEFGWLRLLGGIVLAAGVGGGIFAVMRRK